MKTFLLVAGGFAGGVLACYLGFAWYMRGVMR